MNLEQETIEFLTALEKNNDRTWFLENQLWYNEAKSNLKTFGQEILDQIVKQQKWQPTTIESCMFRINRDVRFSKDKSTYKTWFSLAFSNGGRKQGGTDYYLHIQPNGKSFLGSGMYQPTPEFLKKFRNALLEDSEALKSIIYNTEFKKAFPQIYGKQLKTAPKGIDKGHNEIELLRYNELFFSHNFSDEQVLSSNFTKKVVQLTQILKPYCNYLNQL